MAKKGEKIPEEVLEARRKFRGIRSRKASGDFEVAHSDEDDFRLWVLEKVAAGSPNAVALAKIAIKASLMSFPRNCA